MAKQTLLWVSIATLGLAASFNGCSCQVESGPPAETVYETEAPPPPPPETEVPPPRRAPNTSGSVGTIVGTGTATSGSMGATTAARTPRRGGKQRTGKRAAARTCGSKVGGAEVGASLPFVLKRRADRVARRIAG